MRIQIFFGMAPTLRKNLSRIRFEPNGQSPIRHLLQERIPVGCVSFSGIRRERRRWSKACADALPAAECRCENERWPDFLHQRTCRAAAARPKIMKLTPETAQASAAAAVHCDRRQSGYARAINRKHRQAEIRTQPTQASPAESPETIWKETARALACG